MKVGNHGPFDSIFIGESEMAKRMREHDWSRTSLGSPETWPTALKVALRLLLTSRFEMWLGWGPDINFFYNDAYRPTLGNKHPASLGMPTAVLWKEIWGDIKGRIETVYTKGEATWDRGLLLFLERNGYPEETYHTFSYSPLIGDTGKVEGLFCAVSEETDRVINERRLGSLRELASGLAAASTEDEVLQSVKDSFELNTHDLPFSLTYLFAQDGEAQLALATGIEPGSVNTPTTLQLHGEPWSLASVWGGADNSLRDLRGLGSFPNGAWDRMPEQALIVPLVGQGGTRPLGALIAGLNPYRPVDSGYTPFLKLLAGQIASSLASARAHDVERERAATLADAVRLRQQAAEALAQANQQLTDEVEQRTAELDRMRDLFQQAPSFMAVLQSPDHVFDLANESFHSLVGHRDLLGKAARDALPDVEGQGFFELLDAVLERGEPIFGQAVPVQLRRQPDGQVDERFVNLIYQPIRDGDGVAKGVFVNGFDITHQKRAEQQLKQLNETLEHRVDERTQALQSALSQLQDETTVRRAAEKALRQAQKMEALGNLTGGVAHDFNNLLQVISGNLELLTKDIAGNARAQKRVDHALAGVARGSKLASQLLAFARRQPLEPKVVNLGRFILGMDDMLRRSLGDEVELETIIAGGLWNTMVDPGQVENAILNLAINARDAMGGNGKLTIEAGNAKLDEAYAAQQDELGPGQYVMIAVTDTGMGIPKDVIDHVFEPFFSTKEEGRGTGLGLSMVYGFVKQSGGHIKIYSEMGEGTTVKLYLPRVMRSEEQIPATNPAPAAGGEEAILVVEDDADVREVAVTLLRELGYRVLQAKDAASGLTIVESGAAIDLLFTDVVMPGAVRSTELAQIARTQIPGIAVLFTSGYTENAIFHGGRLDAGVDLLGKPYTRDQLARKVRMVLEKPRPVQGDHPAPLQTEPLAVPPTGANQATVLLVEDDDLIRMCIAEMIGDAGYAVIEVGDGAAAMRAISSEPIDVLVTDVGLPDISGVALARGAREIASQLGVIFVTGDDTIAAEAASLKAGLLRKPFMPDELVEMLKVFVPS